MGVAGMVPHFLHPLFTVFHLLKGTHCNMCINLSRSGSKGKKIHEFFSMEQFIRSTFLDDVYDFFYFFRWIAAFKLLVFLLFLYLPVVLLTSPDRSECFENKMAGK